MHLVLWLDKLIDRAMDWCGGAITSKPATFIVLRVNQHILITGPVNRNYPNSILVIASRVDTHDISAFTLRILCMTTCWEHAEVKVCSVNITTVYCLCTNIDINHHPSVYVDAPWAYTGHSKLHKI